MNECDTKPINMTITEYKDYLLQKFSEEVMDSENYLHMMDIVRKGCHKKYWKTWRNLAEQEYGHAKCMYMLLEMICSCNEIPADHIQRFENLKRRFERTNAWM